MLWSVLLKVFFFYINIFIGFCFVTLQTEVSSMSIFYTRAADALIQETEQP